MEKILQKINNLSLPATVLIASLILGGFYFMAEANKQRSIEKQQQVEIENQIRIEQAKKDKEAQEASTKSDCVVEAESRAVDFYKDTCSYDCKPGMYYISNYESNYKDCLRRNGLE